MSAPHDKISETLNTHHENIKYNRNIRKQYIDYGGKNKVDTYFYVELHTNRCTIIFESGKAVKDERSITVNNAAYIIKSYSDEYTIFFKDLIENRVDRKVIANQNMFWKIYDKIELDFLENESMGKYEKTERNEVYNSCW